MLQGFPALEEMLDIPNHDTPNFVKKQLTSSFTIRESEPKPLEKLKSIVSKDVQNLLQESGQEYECHFARLLFGGITYHTLCGRIHLKGRTTPLNFHIQIQMIWLWTN